MESSVPKRGCCDLRPDGVVCMSAAISSIRLRHLMMRFLASSLLILVVGILASTLRGTLVFIGGKRLVSITYLPQKLMPPFTGLLVPCVQRSSAMLAAKVACIMCE